jgi:nicotinamidase-related amidase
VCWCLLNVQEGFVADLGDEQRVGLVKRIAFVGESARWAGVPVLATLENPAEFRRLHPEVARRLPHTPLFDKEVFGLADDESVFSAVAAAARRAVVLVGLQTDVCVAQSALSLLARGLEVCCVADAVASPGQAHSFGLERMRAAGVTMLCARQLHYEWMRTVAASNQFVEAHPELLVGTSDTFI